MAVCLTWEEQGILLEFSGVVSLSDYRDGLTDMFADQRHRNIHYAICDYSGLTGSEFGLEQVEVIAAFTKGMEVTENWSVAVVASNSETLGKAEFFAAQVTYPFAIFNNIADARKWIHVRPVLA